MTMVFFTAGAEACSVLPPFAEESAALLPQPVSKRSVRQATREGKCIFHIFCWFLSRLFMFCRTSRHHIKIILQNAVDQAFRIVVFRRTDYGIRRPFLLIPTVHNQHPVAELLDQGDIVADKKRIDKFCPAASAVVQREKLFLQRVTSSAEVASSQISSFGSIARALAMAARWHWPPLTLMGIAIGANSPGGRIFPAAPPPLWVSLGRPALEILSPMLSPPGCGGDRRNPLVSGNHLHLSVDLLQLLSFPMGNFLSLQKKCFRLSRRSPGNHIHSGGLFRCRSPMMARHLGNSSKLIPFGRVISRCRGKVFVSASIKIGSTAYLRSRGRRIAAFLAYALLDSTGPGRICRLRTSPCPSAPERLSAKAPMTPDCGKPNNGCAKGLRISAISSPPFLNGHIQRRWAHPPAHWAVRACRCKYRCAAASCRRAQRDGRQNRPPVFKAQLFEHFSAAGLQDLKFLPWARIVSYSCPHRADGAEGARRSEKCSPTPGHSAMEFGWQIKQIPAR